MCSATRLGREEKGKVPVHTHPSRSLSLCMPRHVQLLRSFTTSTFKSCFRRSWWASSKDIIDCLCDQKQQSPGMPCTAILLHALAQTGAFALILSSSTSTTSFLQAIPKSQVEILSNIASQAFAKTVFLPEASPSRFIRGEQLPTEEQRQRARKVRSPVLQYAAPSLNISWPNCNHVASPMGRTLCQHAHTTRNLPCLTLLAEF